MRLNKFIAHCGVCSRRKADLLISDGSITVNGEIVLDYSFQVDPQKDIVECDGVSIHQEEELVYYLFNKPKSCLTTVSDDRGRKTVIDFIKSEYRIYPIGRLDYNSTGVLILTNDGDFYQKVNHIEKTYHVQIYGKISEPELLKLRSGVQIDEHLTNPCSIEIIKNETNKTWLEFKLTEGRNRQIRKMLETVNKKVLKLDRVKFGYLGYEKLKPGDYRILSSTEVHRLVGK